MGKSVFVAASRQHVGKTSTSLGIVAGLQKTFGYNVGFLKPVGQKSVHVRLGDKRLCVDKDVPVFKEVLRCTGSYQDMSPVLIGKGYTRRYLDGEISSSQEMKRIVKSFDSIASQSQFTVVEGTGHVAVGSSVGLSNANVASKLGVPMILVLNGGIGSTLDEFCLNMEFCKSEGAKIRGVILNKVKPEKVEDVWQYTGEALEKLHGVPILGCVPDIESLSNPTVLDFERLGVQLLAGDRKGHFTRVESVLTGVEEFCTLMREHVRSNESPLFIVHSSRVDLLDALESMFTSGQTPRSFGLLVVEHSVKDPLRRCWHEGGFPVLATPASQASIFDKLRNYTAKLSVSDTQRTKAVIEHYASHIDFHALVQVAAGKQVLRFKEKVGL